jgi:inhibitor of KinA
MKARLAGDTLLVVEFDEVIDPIVNARVVELGHVIRRAALAGVRDVVPGYCALGIHFDPLRTDLAALERLVQDAGRQAEAVTDVPVARVVEIPVQYGGVHGPDLDDVARFAGCSPDEVIAQHATTTYRVYMLGFVPGFAYLGRVPSPIAAPRHRVPRERVPAGSVGIAGLQTGVYPIESPGGWQLIGRTTSVMFDATRTPASLLAAGDLVRFVPA